MVLIPIGFKACFYSIKTTPANETSHRSFMQIYYRQILVSYKLRLLDLALILAHLPSLVAPPALASLSGCSEQVRGSLYIPPALDSPNAFASPPPQGEAASMCVCEQMPWLEYSSLCGAHKNKEELTQCTPGSRSN